MCANVCVLACVQICMCVPACVCVRTHTYVCVCVCVDVYVCVCTRIQVCFLTISLSKSVSQAAHSNICNIIHENLKVICTNVPLVFLHCGQVCCDSFLLCEHSLTVKI